MNDEQIAVPIINELSDMIANFIKHPNNDEVRENFQIQSVNGFELSNNLQQLSRL